MSSEATKERTTFVMYICRTDYCMPLQATKLPTKEITEQPCGHALHVLVHV